jgi:hypothetical protein
LSIELPSADNPRQEEILPDGANLTAQAIQSGLE